MGANQRSASRADSDVAASFPGAEKATDRTIRLEINAAIATGQLPPGARLPTERELAEKYGVSRKQVQLALEQLRRDGLIESKVGSGTYVSDRIGSPDHHWTGEPPDISPMDAIEARRVLEVGSVELVTARGVEADFRRMDEALAKMEAAHTGETFREAAFEFNRALLEATHNPLLIAMFDLLVAARAKTGWNRLGFLVDTVEERERSVRQCHAFLEALKMRDGRKAAELRYQGISQLLTRVLSGS